MVIKKRHSEDFVHSASCKDYFFITFAVKMSGLIFEF